MRILVACEFSGIVRQAFRKLGNDAWSCDLLGCDDGEGNHNDLHIVKSFWYDPVRCVAADTAPLAIAKAWLAWKEDEK